MAWSAAFRAALAAPERAMVYRLDVIEVGNAPGSAWSVGSVTSIADDRGLVIRSVALAGGTLSPRTWRATLGSWTVQLSGSTTELERHLTRGTIVALWAGIGTLDPAQMERIAIGQVQALRLRSGVDAELEAWDALSAIRARLEPAYGSHTLFRDMGSDTALAAAYTAGDTEIQVGSTAGFSRRDGHHGALRITPTTGDAFYLSWLTTATGPTRFTDVSIEGVAGTTEVDAEPGDAVQEAAYLVGHPLDIARWVICSTGAETNGSHDVLPEAWGLGLPVELVDDDDVDAYKAVVQPATGDDEWVIVQGEEVQDAISWMESWLSRGGFFFAARQGCVTVRAVQDTWSAAIVVDDEIVDEDIEAIEAWDRWASDHSPEHSLLSVEAGAAQVTSVTEDTATLPNGGTLEVELSDVMSVNSAAWCTELVGRLTQSTLRTPERVSLRLAGRGFRFAGLAAGDIIPLTTARRRRPGTAEVYARHPLKVCQVSVTWGAGKVRVTGWLYPDDGDGLW